MKKFFATLAFAVAALLPFYSFAASLQVSEPEKFVKGIYLGRSFMSEANVNIQLERIRRTELNAVVINTKDDGKNNDGEIYTGEKARAMIGKFKAAGVYVICRMPVFHDTKYAEKHPAVAIKSREKGWFWSDSLSWVWIDPSSQQYWEYFLKIVSESVNAGCDEINIDYIRFPAPIDGNLSDALYPFWNREKQPKCGLIREFLATLRKYRDTHHPRTRLSADVFGYTFLGGGEPGIGQCAEDFATYMDYIYPMSYPSLYWCNDANFGAPDPSFAPYRVQNVTSAKGLAKLRARGFEPKIRPWIQAFSRYNFCRVTKEGCPSGCGKEKAEYGRERVRAQIKGNIDLKDPAVIGWMMWHAGAQYPDNLFDSK